MASPSHPTFDGLPNVAVITMVRDEGRMLPRWIDHYSKEVGVDNLIIIDDNSADGSTDNLPCPVIKIPHLTKKSFEPARMGMLSQLSAAMLEAYDAVIFCDADEFIVADPAKHLNLRHFVATRGGKQAVGVLTLNVVHHVGHEPPLDPTQPILGQRRLAKFVPLMCKPSLKYVAADWVAASHGVRAPFEVDPELYMFHMKFADRGHLQEVADHRKQMVEMDGRAASTNWQHGADEMVALLDQITADLDLSQVKQFHPPLGRISEIVQRYPEGIYRATGIRQVGAMAKRPMVKIPKRFLGRV